MSVIKIVATCLVVISSLLIVLLVLLHKGKGGGLSDMFGGGVSTVASGSSVAERNLNRLTIISGVVWIAGIVTMIMMMKWES